MKIYTGRGDSGHTFDLRGKKISKNDTLIHFLGAIDELNSFLGLVKAMFLSDDSHFSVCQSLENIQKNLMKIMAHCSDIKREEYFIADNDVLSIEKETDMLSEKIPRQHELIVPGKSIMEAQIQITRTIARRAERFFFAVNAEQNLCPQAGVYLNRLSDYLFILSQQE